MNSISHICSKKLLSTSETGDQPALFSGDEPPLDCHRYVNDLVQLARSVLEMGGTVPACVFLGDRASGLFSPLDNALGLASSSTELIKLMALFSASDIILMIGESWMIREDSPLSKRKIRRKFGSIEASPYAVDGFSIAIETCDGIWLSEVEIKRSPKGSRSIGSVEFLRASAEDWEKMRLLPKQR